MSFPADLRAFVLADATLAALIGDRLYPAVLPQRPSLPAVTYQRVSGDWSHALIGGTGLTRVRVQFDCYAQTYAEAETVFHALRQRLDGYQGPMGAHTVQAAFLDDERDFYEPADAGTGSGAGLYRRSGDYVLYYVA